MENQVEGVEVANGNTCTNIHCPHKNCSCRRGLKYTEDENVTLCIVATKFVLEQKQLNLKKVGEEASKKIYGRSAKGLTSYLQSNLLPKAVLGLTPRGLNEVDKQAFIKIARTWNKIKEAKEFACNFGNVLDEEPKVQVADVDDKETQTSSDNNNNVNKSDRSLKKQENNAVKKSVDDVVKLEKLNSSVVLKNPHSEKNKVGECSSSEEVKILKTKKQKEILIITLSESEDDLSDNIQPHPSKGKRKRNKRSNRQRRKKFSKWQKAGLMQFRKNSLWPYFSNKKKV